MSDPSQNNSAVPVTPAPTPVTPAPAANDSGFSADFVMDIPAPAPAPSQTPTPAQNPAGIQGRALDSSELIAALEGTGRNNPAGDLPFELAPGTPSVQIPATPTAPATQTPAPLVTTLNGQPVPVPGTPAAAAPTDPTQVDPLEAARQMMVQMAAAMVGGQGRILTEPVIPVAPVQPTPAALPSPIPGFSMVPGPNGTFVLQPVQAPVQQQAPQIAWPQVPVQQPTPAQVQPQQQQQQELKIENFLTEDELSQVSENPALLNLAFNRAMKGVVNQVLTQVQTATQQHGETYKTTLPKLVSDQVNQAILLQKAVSTFYESNTDLIKYTPFVQQVMTEIEHMYPTKTYREIFDLTAQVSRQRLFLPPRTDLQMQSSGQAPTQVVPNTVPGSPVPNTNPDPPPAFASSRRSGINRPVQASTPDANNVNQLFKDTLGL